MDIIIKDLVAGYLSDVHVATFLTANAAGRLNKNEILDLTKSMFQTGDCLTWPTHFVVDKHCVGGLPGNRTSLIVVPIVAAFGLTMPKTSSRAITSPAGTADTMEVLAPVTLDVKKMQQVVERENGCIVWGGAVSLSPADDLLIRVERVIELDSEGQLVASILSKKISAGATHVVVDIPIGPTAKVRTQETAVRLKHLLEVIGRALNVEIQVVFTEGASPVGRGIGPALEARDVLSVLRNEKDAPADLRERALTLAGHVLSFSPQVAEGTGKQLATTLLTSGQAWEKFQAICLAQGGLFEPPIAPHIHEVCTAQAGKIMAVDNRRLARIAKLAGAPQAKVAGVRWLVELGQSVEQGQPLFEVHAESSGALKYALHYLKHEKNIIQIED